MLRKGGATSKGSLSKTFTGERRTSMPEAEAQVTPAAEREKGGSSKNLKMKGLWREETNKTLISNGRE